MLSSRERPEQTAGDAWGASKSEEEGEGGGSMKKITRRGAPALVAARMRTSTGRFSEVPTGVTSPSCRTRRSFTWVSRLMSPISSRNSVPWLALSNFPLRSAVAPVKAPRTCPNISLSMSSAGMAAQLTWTKERGRRGDSAWMARAISSLPVPRSPEIRTRQRVGAAISTSW